MNFHEYKDIAMIYSSNENGQPDRTWEKAQIVVWDPDRQKRMDLVFTGSERGEKPEDFKIHFNVVNRPEEEQLSVLQAFDDSINKIFPNISNEIKQEYRKVFITMLVNQQNLPVV
jgi:hypothetical protein